jgi:hypothetical protein
MASNTRSSLTADVRTCLATRLGEPGRFVVGSTVAGGLTLGGFLVAAATFSNELAVTAAPQVTQIAFAAGVILGWVHGSVLGYLGRPDGMRPREGTASVIAGAIWSVPAVLAAYFVTLWLSMTRWSFVVEQPFLIAGVILSWILGVSVCAWFAQELLRTARTAMKRWPERRYGVAAIFATFVVLLVILVARQPELWWTEERVSVAGAVILAFGITVWAALPLEVWLLHRFGGMGMRLGHSTKR